MKDYKIFDTKEHSVWKGVTDTKKGAIVIYTIKHHDIPMVNISFFTKEEVICALLAIGEITIGDK